MARLAAAGVSEGPGLGLRTGEPGRMKGEGLQLVLLWEMGS